jgi:Protein of unknown function (DUF4230)
MTGPLPPSPDPPHTRQWWLRAGAVAALVILGAAWWRARPEPPAAVPEPRGTPRVTQDIVVEKVQAVSKLVSSETTVRDVVVYENTWLNSTKRSLVVVTGKVNAGIDLSKGADVQIDDQAKRITVTLPPAEVLGVEITNLRTYDERAGLWNPFTPADRDAIYRRVRAQLVRTGQELGVVQHANESARMLLQTLLATDGYTVDVTFRSRPIVPAKG